MNKQTIQEVEQRFLDLRKLYNESQWGSADILNVKVDELISTDLPLAYRLMQRIKNLDPSPETRRQMTFLKKQLLEQHPELTELTSTHPGKLDRLKQKASVLVKKVRSGTQETNFKSVTKPLYLFVVMHEGTKADVLKSRLAWQVIQWRKAVEVRHATPVQYVQALP